MRLPLDVRLARGVLHWDSASAVDRSLLVGMFRELSAAAVSTGIYSVFMLARVAMSPLIWFAVGMFTVLEVLMAALRNLAWCMHVEDERAERDLKLIELGGILLIYFITPRVHAAMYSEMGRVFQSTYSNIGI